MRNNLEILLKNNQFVKLLKAVHMNSLNNEILLTCTDFNKKRVVTFELLDIVVFKKKSL